MKWIGRLLTPAAVVVLAAIMGFAWRGEQPVQAANASIWGDGDCSGVVSIGDAIGVARHLVGLSVNAPAGCPGIGDTINVGGDQRIWGDIDCSGSITIGDAIGIARSLVGLSVNQAEGCPAIGSNISAGVTLDGDVVSSINGEQMLVSHLTGDELASADSDWPDYFASINTQASDVEASTSVPGLDSSLDLKMLAIRAEGTDWATMLANYIAEIRGHPEMALTVAEQTVGGKDVWQIVASGQFAATSYYYAGGDTVYLVDTSDPDVASQVLGALPLTAASGPAARPEGARPQGSGPLRLQIVQPILPPVCVGAQRGSKVLQMLAIDFATGMPTTASFIATPTRGGTIDPPVSLGSFGTFLYQATNFGSGQEELDLKASSPAGGLGVDTDTFPVQHCLNGTWQDGPRTITISQHTTQVTAEITSGTLVCGEAGTAFTATLGPADSSFSGGDLKVCNPDECVNADVLDKTAVADYTATISSDGNTIEFDWTRQLYDVVTTDGNVTACNPSSTEQESFTMTRLTFGPDTPF